MKPISARNICFYLFPVVLVCFCCATSSPSFGQAQGQVCGDPAARCVTSFSFQPYDLPFVIKGKLEFKEYQSNFFYAVILKSVAVTKEGGDCLTVPEQERLEVQRLLPRNKVFASHLDCPENQVLYDGVSQTFNI